MYTLNLFNFVVNANYSLSNLRNYVQNTRSNGSHEDPPKTVIPSLWQCILALLGKIQHI